MIQTVSGRQMSLAGVYLTTRNGMIDKMIKS